MNFTFLFDGTQFNIPKTERLEKGKSLIAFPDSYCVVDTETTGLSPDWDHVIEIGAIRYVNGQEIERFQSLVQPPAYDDGSYIDGFIEELTGITNEMLADAPQPIDVYRAFDSFLGESLIVGYNVGFDINFLYDGFEEYLNKPLTNDYIDAMRMSRKLYSELPHHRLKDMVKHFGISHGREHRALSDVEATNACFCRLKDEALQQYGSEDAFQKTFNRKHSAVKANDIQGDESKIDIDSPLYNKYCVFTGKLEKFTRREAMQIVADLGGINEDGVTKKTNYLILGNNDYCATIKDGKSSKQKKAEKLKLGGQDIEIVPETVFYDMISDY